MVEIAGFMRGCPRIGAAILASSILTACASIGPRHVVHDRFDYADALSRSWKENMLLNLVKLRYADAPLFLDVSSIVEQYTLQGQLTAGAQFPVNSGANPSSVGGTVEWADRPTISYQPLTGSHFTKSLLTPIKPVEVMNLVQAGWPVPVVFRFGVRSNNGIGAGILTHLTTQAEDPRFAQLVRGARPPPTTGRHRRSRREEGRPGNDVSHASAKRRSTSGGGPAVRGGHARPRSGAERVSPHLRGRQRCEGRDRRRDARGLGNPRRAFLRRTGAPAARSGRPRGTATPRGRSPSDQSARIERRGPARERLYGRALSRLLVLDRQSGLRLQAHPVLHDGPPRSCRDGRGRARAGVDAPDGPVAATALNNEDPSVAKRAARRMKSTAAHAAISGQMRHRRTPRHEPDRHRIDRWRWRVGHSGLTAFRSLPWSAMT